MLKVSRIEAYKISRFYNRDIGAIVILTNKFVNIKGLLEG